MSGFSADWLRLREPADHRARDAGLAKALAAHFHGRQAVTLLDLGCGAGSNLRALAPMLPMSQHWRLADHDRELLDAAREEIERWRSTARIAELTYSLEPVDLARDAAALLAGDCDIVTASALFDLVSADWIGRFVPQIAGRGAAFYTVLIYNGEMRWSPDHELDERICRAFNEHQRADKGFGAAAGPDAGKQLCGALERAGYKVTTASSPWCLGAKDRPLILALAQGIAQAAGETGLIEETGLASWLASRTDVKSCEIGHTDLLALQA